MTEEQVNQWITKLIQEDRLHDFYISKEWRKLRKDVIEEAKGECQICKCRGLYAPANTVHHVQYVRKHPRYALSKTYTFKGEVKQNLIALCNACHEEVHNYRHEKKEEKPLTEERWY